MSAVNTANDLFVERRGDGGISILGLRVEMSEEQALRLAAWLVAIVGDDEQFAKILQQIRSFAVRET